MTFQQNFTQNHFTMFTKYKRRLWTNNTIFGDTFRAGLCRNCSVEKDSWRQFYDMNKSCADNKKSRILLSENAA